MYTKETDGRIFSRCVVLISYNINLCNLHFTIKVTIYHFSKVANKKLKTITFELKSHHLIIIDMCTLICTAKNVSSAKQPDFLTILVITAVIIFFWEY